MSKYIDCHECNGEGVIDPQKDKGLECKIEGMPCTFPSCACKPIECPDCEGEGRILDEELPEESTGDDHDCYENDEVERGEE